MSSWTSMVSCAEPAATTRAGGGSLRWPGCGGPQATPSVSTTAMKSLTRQR